MSHGHGNSSLTKMGHLARPPSRWSGSKAGSACVIPAAGRPEEISLTRILEAENLKRHYAMGTAAVQAPHFPDLHGCCHRGRRYDLHDLPRCRPAGYIKSQGGSPENMFLLPWWLIAGGILFSILVSLVAGSYPAARAARLDPIRALRHD